MKFYSILASLLFVTAFSFGISSTILFPTGVIHIEDEVLSVTVSGPEEVQHIAILDSNGDQVFEQTGCFSSSCSYGLGNLSSGGYTAIVTTNEKTFSEDFQL